MAIHQAGELLWRTCFARGRGIGVHSWILDRMCYPVPYGLWTLWPFEALSCLWEWFGHTSGLSNWGSQWTSEVMSAWPALQKRIGLRHSSHIEPGEEGLVTPKQMRHRHNQMPRAPRDRGQIREEQVRAPQPLWALERPPGTVESWVRGQVKSLWFMGAQWQKEKGQLRPSTGSKQNKNELQASTLFFRLQYLSRITEVWTSAVPQNTYFCDAPEAVQKMSKDVARDRISKWKNSSRPHVSKTSLGRATPIL